MPIKTAENSGWQDYTPVWTAVTTNPVLGNGTLIGKYIRTGRKVTVIINLQPGTTTTFGSGGWRFSLPFRIQRGVGLAHALDAGTARYAATLLSATATTILLWQADLATGTEFAAATPFTWTSGDILDIEYTYETDEE